MVEFIKIFERDRFGDKATQIIKQECRLKKEKQAEELIASIVKSRKSHGNSSHLSDSDIASIRSMSGVSKGSVSSKKSKRSLY